ncbi:MAG: hypothetical protein HY908_28135 [Myxococcales bacterium]|nr:hypothetical protein [Myxococcales bacterium]
MRTYAAAVAACAVALTGCSRSDIPGAQGISFGANCAVNVSPVSCAPELLPPESPQSCTGFGVLDTSYAKSYQALLWLQPLEEPAVIELTSIHVEVEFLGAPLIRQDGTPAIFDAPVTGFMPQPEAEEPVFVAATLLDERTAEGLAEHLEATWGIAVEVLSSFVLHGRTAAGVPVSSWQSGKFVKPCSGCLCTVPPEAQDPAGPPGNCDAPTPPEPNCRIGMDAPVDCRLVGNTCD